MAIFCGLSDDDGISQYLKCLITQTINDQSVTVKGYISEDSQLTLSSSWEAPFESDSAGDSATVQKGAAIAQATTGATSKTSWNTQKVWQGTPPPEINIVLQFIAFKDAYREVDLPIQYLLQMASPELNKALPVSSDGGIGRIPEAAVFNIGRKLIIPAHITNVSYNLNAPKTPKGNFAYNTVTLTVEPMQMINKSEITNYFK